MIKNNKVKIMGIISSIILLVVVITASFAYFGSFNVNLNNNVAVNVNSVSPGNGTFVSNGAQLNLQVPAANMSLTASDNTVAAASNTAALTVSLTSGSDEIETTCTFDIYYEYTGSNFYGVSPTTKTSGVTKEITMTVNAPSGTSNFSTETNFDYNTSIGWVTENSIRKVKLVENATISNYGTTATTQEYIFTGKYYNLDVSQEQLANQSFNGIIYVANNECKSEQMELFDFYLDDVHFYALKNMTWEEWITSDYANNWNYKTKLLTYDEAHVICNNSTRCKGIDYYYPFNYCDECYSGDYNWYTQTNYLSGIGLLKLYTGNDDGFNDYNNYRSGEGCIIKKNESILQTMNLSDSLANIASNFKDDNKYYIYAVSQLCLTPETLIDVEEEDKKGKKRRKRKMLKDIKVGDKVICVNPDTLQLDTDIVTECDSAFIKRHTCYDKWYFESGTVITTVHRHRFYNVENKTFMYMDEWNIGDHGINIDGNKVKLIKHEHIEEEVVHATLFTKKYNNYFANGMLSGNRHSKEINL